MSDQLSIILLASGPGAAIGLLALGLITIYRSSNVLYLAQPAMASVGAYLYYELARPGRYQPWGALILAALLTGLLSVGIYFLVMRPLHKTSALTKLVASIGVAQVLVAAIMFIYGEEYLPVEPLLPQGPMTLPGGIVIGRDRFLLLIIAIAATAILWAVYRFTRFGIATSAVAESPFFASVYGLGGNRLAVINWMVAGTLAGSVGAVLSQVVGLNIGVMSDLLIPVLAAALIGSMTSFPIALLGAVVIASIQAWVTSVTDTPGLVELVPFVAMLAVMLWRGEGTPLRNFTAPKLPAIGTGRIRWIAAVLVLGGLVASIYTWVPEIYYRPLLTCVTMSIVLLSLVIVTGYAGQLSLAQFALAGFAAFCAGNLASSFGWAFPAALVAGVLAASALGAVLAIVTVRLRGVNLGVLTLSFGVVLCAGVLSRSEGIEIAPPEFFGIDVSMVTSPRNYLALAALALALSLIAAANIRRGRSGRRMIAVRGNERAASSLGINVTRTKVVAFALAAGVAGLGGVLIGFQSPSQTFDAFVPWASAELVSWVTIGGLGFLVGPMIGSTLAPGSLGTSLGTAIYDNTAVLGFIGGILVILTLINHPDGAASLVTQIRAHRAHRAHQRARTANGTSGDDRVAVEASASLAGQGPLHAPIVGKSLRVSSVSKAFGGVQALSEVSFEVHPGSVHGLIGSNGSGKTTLLDVVSGFTKASGGEVYLGDVALNELPAWRRARLGLGRSFQNGQLLTDLPVEENITLGQAAAGGNVVRELAVPERITLTPLARSVVATLGLEDLLGSSIDALSHGKRQLVSIARAVAEGPSLVLLDEPAAGLDDVERQEFGSLIRRLASDYNIGILLVEHDVQLVLNVCDRVTVLHNGRVIAEGDPAAIRSSTVVREAYLGEGAAPSAAAQSGGGK